MFFSTACLHSCIHLIMLLRKCTYLSILTLRTYGNLLTLTAQMLSVCVRHARGRCDVDQI